MIYEAISAIYRLIVLFILACTVWAALDEEEDARRQVIAALLVIPLLLRALMIK